MNANSIEFGSLTTAQRDALGSVPDGTTIWNSSNVQLETYSPGGWISAASLPFEITASSVPGNTGQRSGYEIYTFTGSGTMNIQGPPSPGIVAEYLVIAGGGGGGSGEQHPGGDGGGGAGAGGYREGTFLLTPGPYTITVGSGGVGQINYNPWLNGTPARGQSSTIAYPGPNIVATGGGSGGSDGSNNGSNANGEPGGSGGGGGCSGPSPGGSGNTPPVSPPQGNGGGSCPGRGDGPRGGAGGGGAGGGGGSGQSAGGGGGRASSINGSPATRGGGGGGGGGGGRVGGGGGGPGGGGPGYRNGRPGGTNQGGGGGGCSNGGFGNPSPGGTGGSGLVIIAVPTG